MIKKTFVNRLAISSRRHGLATATVYGLSLAVRFTSAAGEEVELPVQSAQRAKSVMSIMTETGPRLPYEDWTNAARACESSRPMSMPDGLRP
ncbi:hypothetical protein [Bradyrhizobium roseum]|uniref:hypothetical protein n=1 Tax=Bradyrhizobium roseum TaxID=3056648 RepID=UPI00260503CB|nr:hypothetical protein [Bradyrhizobium roseus]WKA29322.1 hypothetical protein QUH67_03780 [Bradyrhizobium roseus]